MAKQSSVKWLDQPEEKDYPAAASYLGLLFKPQAVRSHILALRRAAPAFFAAKDVLRASGLPLLPVTNAHVKRDDAKIRAGTRLSPILLVRKSKQEGLIVADGYHRLCAVCIDNEDAMVPCRIAG